MRRQTLRNVFFLDRFLHMAVRRLEPSWIGGGVGKALHAAHLWLTYDAWCGLLT